MWENIVRAKKEKQEQGKNMKKEDTTQQPVKKPDTTLTLNGTQAGDAAYKKRKTQRSLADEVARFCEWVIESYPRRSPARLKKRVLELVTLKLPPLPKKSGPKPKATVTRAYKAWIGLKAAKKSINWVRIAEKADHSFKGLKSYRARRQFIEKLRTAVYKRDEREKYRKQQRKQSALKGKQSRPRKSIDSSTLPQANVTT